MKWDESHKVTCVMFGEKTGHTNCFLSLSALPRTWLLIALWGEHCLLGRGRAASVPNTCMLARMVERMGLLPSASCSQGDATACRRGISSVGTGGQVCCRVRGPCIVQKLTTWKKDLAQDPLLWHPSSDLMGSYLAPSWVLQLETIFHAAPEGIFWNASPFYIPPLLETLSGSLVFKTVLFK